MTGGHTQPSAVPVGRQDQDAHAGETHDRGGHERPPLRLIGPSLGEHGQHRPGSREHERTDPGDDVFWRPGEWSDNRHDGTDEPADRPTRATMRPM